jgi:hypothetical protein
MKHTRFTVIDPDRRMIMMFRHVIPLLPVMQDTGLNAERSETSSVRSQQRLILLRVQVGSRHRIDPAQMVVNFRDA